MLEGFCPQLHAEPLACLGAPARRQLCKSPADPTPVRRQTGRGEQQQNQALGEQEETRMLLRRAEGPEARSLPAQAGHLLEGAEPSAGFKRKAAAGECISPPQDEGRWLWSPETEEVEQWASPARRLAQPLQCLGDPLLPARLLPGDSEETAAWLIKAGWSAALPVRRPRMETTAGCASSCCWYPGPGMEGQMVTDYWLPEE